MLNIFTVPVALLSFILLTGYSSSGSSADEWKLFQTHEGIEVYYRTVVEKTPSYHHEYVEFKYLNTTDQALSFSGKLDVWLGNTCRSCHVTAPSDYHFSLVLPAGQAKEGPSDSLGLYFRFMKNNLNNEQFKQVTRFEFSQLTVSAV